MPDENATAGVNVMAEAQTGLEEEAEAYLHEQERKAEQAYRGSAITLVVNLMPADDHPQGRSGVISVRNDQDAPLFGPMVHEDELVSLLQTPPVARLLNELKALLPQRFEERQRREAQATSQAASIPAIASAAKGGKVAKKPAGPGVNANHATPATTPALQLPIATGAASDISQEGVILPATTTPPQNDLPVTPPPPPGKTTQLTMF